MRQLPLPETERAEAGSFVFAPVSLAAVLALSYEAARGATRAELGRALGLSADSDATEAVSLARLAEFGTSAPLRAQHATAVWVAPHATPRPAFRDRATSDYQVAFLAGKAGESPTTAINDWLTTNQDAPGNILLAPDALRADAQFVLVDFLSVAGAWRTPFAVERTRPLAFTNGDGKQLQLPTMTSVGTLLATSGSDFDAIELALQSPEHHLCIVVPKLGQMAALQGSLGERFAAIRSALRPTYAELQLPRFTVESKLSLKEALTAVGIVAAFSKAADFGAMSESPVYLEQVLQNVTFEVNERGLRAASATAASFPPPSAPKTPALIRVNRPFLFSLLNIRTGAVLFSGRYSGPSP